MGSERHKQILLDKPVGLRGFGIDGQMAFEEIPTSAIVADDTVFGFFFGEVLADGGDGGSKEGFLFGDIGKLLGDGEEVGAGE